MLRLCCIDAPKITVAPTDQKVVENGAVTLFCRASGHPTPDVFWRRAGRRITSNHQRYTVVTVQQGGVAVLRVEPAKDRRDDSVFECVAENGVGEPATATAKLDVYPEGQGQHIIYLLVLYCGIFYLFTHPRSPLGGANAYMFYRCFFVFFLFFSVRQKI